MQLIEIVSIACISLLLVLAFYLLIKGRKQNSPFHLIGLFFLLLAFNFTDGLLYLSGFYLKHPNFSGWEEALVLLYGPILLYFAQHTIGSGQQWTLKKVLHLLPFAIFQTLIIVFYHTLSTQDKQQVIALAISQQTPTGVLLFQLVLITHISIYTFYARGLIIRHKEKLKAVFSSQMITWAQSVYDYLILLLALSLSATLIHSFGHQTLYLVAIFMIVATTVFFLFGLLVNALDHPLLTLDSGQLREQRLEASEAQELKERIEQFFLREKAFTNPELTIKDLAEQLAEPMRDVSYVVNTHMASNFYDLVNSYRIDAAKALLTETTQPITNILYKVGFNSKSSFNTQFKLKTGETPSAYRKQTQSQR